MRTPWGASQDVINIVPGIIFVSTAGHGGIRLDAARRKKLPASILARSRYAPRNKGWFEEDCEALIPLIVFYDEIRAVRGSFATNTERAEYIKSLDQWCPEDAADLRAAGII